MKFVTCQFVFWSYLRMKWLASCLAQRGTLFCVSCVFLMTKFEIN